MESTTCTTDLAPAQSIRQHCAFIDDEAKEVEPERKSSEEMT